MGYCKIGNDQCEKPWFGDVWSTCILGTPLEGHQIGIVGKHVPSVPSAEKDLSWFPWNSWEFTRIHHTHPHSTIPAGSVCLCGSCFVVEWKLLCGGMEADRLVSPVWQL